MTRKARSWASFICVAGFLVLGEIFCARQIGPGGGPVDKIPPEVVFTSPLNRTLNQPKTVEIQLGFSEWVDEQSVLRSLSLFPVVPDGFKVRVKGSQVFISPKTSFKDSTTYHIEFSTLLSDLHGVTMRRPYTFFFSTGNTIDSARIKGCIRDTAEGSTQRLVVALFEVHNQQFSDSIYLALPTYLTQSDSFGSFTFEHIKPGTYQCVAFMDADHNSRITVERERLFGSVRQPCTASYNPEPVILFPLISDTTTASISWVKPVSPKILLGKWNRSYGSSFMASVSSWKIISHTGQGLQPTIAAYIPVRDTLLFALRLNEPVATGSFSLVYGVNRRFNTSPGNVAVEIDTLRFNGSTIVDSIPPQLQRVMPIQGVDLRQVMEIAWSKPVRSRITRLFCVDSLRDSIPMLVDTGFLMRTRLFPQRNMKPQTKYRLELLPQAFEDLVGNKPLMSADTGSKTSKQQKNLRIDISTFEARQLCFSIGGYSACNSESDSQRIWYFTMIDTRQRYFSKNRKTGFRFDSIRAGRGTIGYFLDVNNDGVYNCGSLFPYRAPEMLFLGKDTIEARKNWDIDSIAIQDCEKCPARIMDSVRSIKKK